MVGTASVHDSCGQVGSVYTNAIVPIPANGLSTISLNLPIGATFINREFGTEEIASYTKQVKLEDLACPTWGLVASEDPIREDYLTVGSPFFPIIHPPSELFSYDHAWGRCSSFRAIAIGEGFLDKVFDTPRIDGPRIGVGGPFILAPASALAPAENPVDVITISDPQPTVQTPPKPDPGHVKSSGQPQITKSPSSPNLGKQSSENAGQNRPGDPGRDSPDETAKPGLKQVKNEAPPEPPTATDKDATISIVDQDPTISFGGIGNQQSNLKLGAIIFSAFGGSVAPKGTTKRAGRSTISLSTLLDSPLVYVVGGSSVTADPSVMTVGGTKVSQNGPAINVAGTPVRLDPSGIIIGTNNLPLPASAPALITAAGQVITISNPSAISIAGSTLLAGGDPVVIPGARLSLAPQGNLIVDFDGARAGKENPVMTGSPLDGNDQILAVQRKGFAVAGVTLHPGGPAITIAGTPMSMADSGEISVGGGDTLRPSSSPLDVVGGKALTASSTPIVPAGAKITPFSQDPWGRIPGGSNAMPPYPFAYTIAGHVIGVGPSVVKIGDTTLHPGGAGVIISSTPISLASAGNLIIGSSTVLLPKYLPETVGSTFTIDGHVFTASPSGLSVDGTAINRGADITVSGLRINLGSSGELVVGSSTIMLSQSSAPAMPSVFTLGGQLFTAYPSGLSVGGTTIIPGGGGITISGTPISLGPSGDLIVGSRFSRLLPPTPPSVLTINGHHFTSNSSLLQIDGHTLVPGGQGITVSGTPISLDSSGTLRVGTDEIPPATTGGLGNDNAAHGTSEAFLGAQFKLRASMGMVWWGLMAGLGGCGGGVL